MYFELNFQPTPQTIGVVRRSVMSLYERILGDAEASARIGLATHELLENVLRHSVGGQTTLHICAEDGPSGRVTIETRSRATEVGIADLRARAAAMASCDAETYYANVMVECATRDDDGGLGLARIRAEGEMTLDVQADGDYVSVVASTMPLGKAA